MCIGKTWHIAHLVHYMCRCIIDYAFFVLVFFFFFYFSTDDERTDVHLVKYITLVKSKKVVVPVEMHCFEIGCHFNGKKIGLFFPVLQMKKSCGWCAQRTKSERKVLLVLRTARVHKKIMYGKSWAHIQPKTELKMIITILLLHAINV